LGHLARRVDDCAEVLGGIRRQRGQLPEGRENPRWAAIGIPLDGRNVAARIRYRLKPASGIVGEREEWLPRQRIEGALMPAVCVELVHLPPVLGRDQRR
jgi:hypothetical protein